VTDVLNVISWNIAAVNNNPFEYWITHKDAGYNNLMEGVQEFIDSPGDRDVEISSVFTPGMYEELSKCMEAEGWMGLSETRAEWEGNYANRKIIAGFMKDKDIGAKRLASMPDRITNTINCLDKGQVCRPTVINVYEARMDSVEEWWPQWRDFMFKEEVRVRLKGGALTGDLRRPCQLLDPIKQAKYPAITKEEEAISVPLQTLCQAIFDAILVHIMGSVAPGTWHPLKLQLCNSLVKNKEAIILNILATTYASSHAIFLQEVASVFCSKASAMSLGSSHHILAPAKVDGKKDQNSIILLSKEKFDVGTLKEITEDVIQELGETKDILADGDLFAITLSDKSGNKYLMASFHGDTNGLATVPVVKAVLAAQAKLKGGYQLIFGLDANTHEKGVPGKIQGMQEFAEFYVSAGLTSCWGDNPDPKLTRTTFNARTYLQPQLNKAVKMSEKENKGDVNPKDFILFSPKDFKPTRAFKDNTGKQEYIEGMVFPTLDFPSDHGVLGVDLKRVAEMKSEL